MPETVEIKIQDRLEIMKRLQAILKRNPCWQTDDINTVEKVIYEKHKHDNSEYLSQMQVITVFLEHTIHLPHVSTHLSNLILKGHSFYQVIQSHLPNDLARMEHHLENIHTAQPYRKIVKTSQTGDSGNISRLIESRGPEGENERGEETRINVAKNNQFLLEQAKRIGRIDHKYGNRRPKDYKVRGFRRKTPRMQECVFSDNSEEDTKYQEQQIQLHQKLEEEESKMNRKSLSRVF